MISWQRHKKLRIFIKALCILLTITFLSYDLVWAGATEVLPFKNLASLSQMPFAPPTLKYLSVNEANPRNYFNFLLDKGQLSVMDKITLNKEARQLINYFFLGITLPDNVFWVNLKPTESDRITSEQLSQTDLGRTLLEQDFRLKRDMSQYLNPQNPIGRRFWEKLYSVLGKDKINKVSITTSNRVWIVPAEAVVVETDDGALLAKSSLKVLLESEYAALKTKSGVPPPIEFSSSNNDYLKSLTEQLIKEIVIPAITKDVNESQNYAPLRQIYHSLILAQWFKRKHKNTDSDYAKAINKGYLKGLESQLPWEKQQIWQEYLKSYNQGEYKIKDTIFGLKRMYFSGGVLFDLGAVSTPLTIISQKELPELLKQDPNILNKLTKSDSFKDDLVVLTERKRNQDNLEEKSLAQEVEIVSFPTDSRKRAVPSEDISLERSAGNDNLISSSTGSKKSISFFERINKTILSISVFTFVSLALPAQSFAATLRGNILSIEQGDTWGHIVAKFFMKSGEKLWGNEGSAITNWNKLSGHQSDAYKAMDHIRAGAQIDVSPITRQAAQITQPVPIAPAIQPTPAPVPKLGTTENVSTWLQSHYAEILIGVGLIVATAGFIYLAYKYFQRKKINRVEPLVKPEQQIVPEAPKLKPEPATDQPIIDAKKDNISSVDTVLPEEVVKETGIEELSSRGAEDLDKNILEDVLAARGDETLHRLEEIVSLSKDSENEVELNRLQNDYSDIREKVSKDVVLSSFNELSARINEVGLILSGARERINNQKEKDVKIDKIKKDVASWLKPENSETDLDVIYKKLLSEIDTAVIADSDKEFLISLARESFDLVLKQRSKEIIQKEEEFKLAISKGISEADLIKLQSIKGELIEEVKACPYFNQAKRDGFFSAIESQFKPKIDEIQKKLDRIIEAKNLFKDLIDNVNIIVKIEDEKSFIGYKDGFERLCVEYRDILIEIEADISVGKQAIEQAKARLEEADSIRYAQEERELRDEQIDRIKKNLQDLKGRIAQATTWDDIRKFKRDFEDTKHSIDNPEINRDEDIKSLLNDLNKVLKDYEFRIRILLENIPSQDKNIWQSLSNRYSMDSKNEIKRILVNLAGSNAGLQKLIDSLFDNEGVLKEVDMKGEYEQFKIQSKLKADFDKSPEKIENGLAFKYNNREFRLVLAPRDILDVIGGYISADCTDPGFNGGVNFLKYVLSHIRSPGFLKFRLYGQSRDEEWDWVGNVYAAVIKNKNNQPIFLIDALQLPSKDTGPFETSPKPNIDNLPFQNFSEAANVAEQAIDVLIKYAENSGFKEVYLGFISNFFEPKGGLVGYFQDKYAEAFNKGVAPLSGSYKLYSEKIKPALSEGDYMSRFTNLGIEPVGVNQNVLDSFPREEFYTRRGFAKIWPLSDLSTQDTSKRVDENLKMPSPYSALIFDIDGTLTANTTEINKHEETLKQLLIALEKGISIALVSAQGMAETKEYVIKFIPKNLLKNITVYSAGGAKSYGFNENGEEYLLYDDTKDSVFGNGLKDVISVIRDNVGRGAVIEYRDGIVTITNISDQGKAKRDLVFEFSKRNWKLLVKTAGKATIHVFLQGSDKGRAAKHFYGLILKEKHNSLIPQEKILIIGDAFGPDGLDLDMAKALPNAHIINVGHNYKTPNIKSSEDLINKKGPSATLVILRDYILKGKALFSIAILTLSLTFGTSLRAETDFQNVSVSQQAATPVNSIASFVLYLPVFLGIGFIIWYLVSYSGRHKVDLIYKQLLDYLNSGGLFGEISFEDRIQLRKIAKIAAKKSGFDINNIDVFEVLNEGIWVLSPEFKSKRLKLAANLVISLNRLGYNSKNVLQYGIGFLIKNTKNIDEFEEGVRILESVYPVLHSTTIKTNSLSKFIGESSKDFVTFKIVCKFVIEALKANVNPEVLDFAVEDIIKTSKDTKQISRDLEAWLDFKVFMDRHGFFKADWLKDKNEDQVIRILKIIPVLLQKSLLSTQLLVETAEKTTSQAELDKLIFSWQSTISDFKNGKLVFNINNPLHVDLEYTTYERIANQINSNLSYDSYINVVNKFRSSTNASTLSNQEYAEIKIAVYEASRLLDFIKIIKNSTERPIWVVANLTYGKFAISPILDELGKLGIEIHNAKIGSSECHNHPNYIKPTLFTDEEYARIMKERPMIIVVDGTQHLLARPEERKSSRYPDAYIGYRNFIAVVNDVNQAKSEEFLDKVKINQDFLNSLKADQNYKELAEKLKKSLNGDHSTYALEFWNPGGLQLVVREARKEIQEILPFDPQRLDGNPMLVFVNGVLMDEDLPKEIKDWAKLELPHTPAYYDDKDIIKNTQFAINGIGIYLSHGLEYEVSKATSEYKKLFYKEPAETRLQTQESQSQTQLLMKPIYDAMIFDLDGTLADTLKPADQELLNNLTVFLNAGTKVAIVTSQGLPEVKTNILDRLKDDSFLRNLFVYACRGAQAFNFDSAGKPMVLYDHSTDFTREHWEYLKTAVKNILGNEKAEILDRGVQITVHLNEKNKLNDFANKIQNEVKGITAKLSMPELEIETMGKRTINILLKNMNKGVAVKHFVELNQIEPMRVIIVGDKFGDNGSDRAMVIPGARIVSVGDKNNNKVPQGVEAYSDQGWHATNRLLKDIIHKSSSSPITGPIISLNFNPVILSPLLAIGFIISVKLLRAYRLYSKMNQSISFLKLSERIKLFMKTIPNVPWFSLKSSDPYELLIKILPWLAQNTNDDRLLEVSNTIAYFSKTKLDPQEIIRYGATAISAKTNDKDKFAGSLKLVEQYVKLLMKKRFNAQMFLKDLMSVLNKSTKTVEEFNEGILLSINLLKSGYEPSPAYAMLPEISSYTSNFSEYRTALYAVYKLTIERFEPTAYLIKTLISYGNSSIDKTIADWKILSVDIKLGKVAFDVNNPLHVDLEYTRFRELVDRTLKQQQHRYSYQEYLSIIKNADKQASVVGLDNIEKVEVKYAAYESFRLMQFISKIYKQAKIQGKNVWIVPNLSYGRFAVSPILDDLITSGVEVHYARIGSTESHRNPQLIKPDLFGNKLYDRIINEKPIIIVVDGTQHLLARPKDRKSSRYPDAYVGYRNLVIAVNDLISGRKEKVFKNLVKTSGSFISELRKTPDYEKLSRRFFRFFKPGGKQELYSMEFWNPGGLDLAIREARKETRFAKPFDANKLSGPTLIFINSALLDDDIPRFVKKEFGSDKIVHTPAYFDDTSRIQNILFDVNSKGVHLSDNLYKTLRNEYNRIKLVYEPSLTLDTQPWQSDLPFKTGIFDLDGTLSNTLTPISKAVLNKLLYLMQAGMHIALITVQSLDELNRNVIKEVPKAQRPLLRNLILYPCTGSQAWGFDNKGNLISEPFYDASKTYLSAEQNSAWRKIIRIVLEETGLNKSLADLKGKILAQPASIVDGYAQIIIRLNERRDLRDIVFKKLSDEFIKVGLPLALKKIGRTSIRINIDGIDKGYAVGFHIKEIAKELGIEIEPKQVLVVGNSFDENGDDRQMWIKDARVVSVGSKPVDHDLRKGIEFYPIKGWQGTSYLLSEIINAPKTKIIKTTPIEEINNKAQYIAKKYPGMKIAVIGATGPTKEYSPDIGAKLGRSLRMYMDDKKGYIFTGGVSGVGVDVYKGINIATKIMNQSDDRFFALLPEDVGPDLEYKRISPDVKAEGIGRNMYDRRIGIAKLADVVIVLNGRGGTMHEAITALENGKKVIVLNYGGAGSLLYNAKRNNSVGNLASDGLKPEHLSNIILSDIDNIINSLKGDNLLLPAASSSSINNQGGIDLGNIELTLKDEKFVSSLNPADLKILRAARALKEGQDSLAVLYIHEVRLMLKDSILSESDIVQKALLQSLLSQLERKELLNPEAIEFCHNFQEKGIFPVRRLALVN